jgi:hypothetical protein
MVRCDHEMWWDRWSLLFPFIMTWRHKSVRTSCISSRQMNLILGCRACNWHKHILAWTHCDRRLRDGWGWGMTRWRRECRSCWTRTAKGNYNREKFVTKVCSYILKALTKQMKCITEQSQWTSKMFLSYVCCNTRRNFDLRNTTSKYSKGATETSKDQTRLLGNWCL